MCFPLGTSGREAEPRPLPRTRTGARELKYDLCPTRTPQPAPRPVRSRGVRGQREQPWISPALPLGLAGASCLWGPQRVSDGRLPETPPTSCAYRDAGDPPDLVCLESAKSSFIYFFKSFFSTARAAPFSYNVESLPGSFSHPSEQVT